MNFIITLLILFAAIAILLTIIALFVFLRVFGRFDGEDVNSDILKNNPHYVPHLPLMLEGAKWVKANKTQDVFITSHDGYNLKGVFVKADNPIATIVLVHGFKSSALNDFGAVTKFYHDFGLNLLLVTQRAHGKSEGKYLTFGVKERFDCVMWADFAAKQYGLPVFLDGMSMGCASVLMASELKLNPMVKGIIGDSGYTSPYAIIKHFAVTKTKIPPFPMIQLVDLWARLLGGFSLHECSTIRAVKNNKLPIMLLHGTADSLVPCYMGQENFKAITSEKDIIIADGAEHGLSYMIQKDLCEQKITDFILKHIND